MNADFADNFPLSKTKKVKGTRRMAREKVLQTLIAYKISDTSLDILFPHIFFRMFNINEEEEHHDRLLRPDEIFESEADIPINWKEEDVDFGQKLIQLVVRNTDEYDKLIIKFAENWEIERIALIDRVLMHMAFAELINFEEIPTKVSVNEVIEIAKFYSTDKSGIFINGILDSVMMNLTENNSIKKIGRGLKDS